MKSRAILFCVLSILFYNSNAQIKNTDSNWTFTTKTISESNRLYFQAFIKRDSSLLTSNYTENCWIMTSGTTLCGPTAALDFYKTTYHDKGVRNGKMITNELYGDGDQFIIEDGFYQFLDKDNRLLENGTFLTVWEKKKEGWVMLRSSFHNHNN